MASFRALDIDALRALVTVAELGSFTATAARLHLTQSGVSMRIRRLENVEGVRLLVRGSRSVELTPEGAALLPHARRMLELNEEARAALRSRPGTQVVRLGAMEDYATRVLPELLSEFSRIEPGISVEVQIGITGRMLHDPARLHDVLLAMHREGETSEGARLCSGAPVWAAAPSFLAPRKGALPLALYAEGCPFRVWAVEALEAARRPWRLAYASPSQAAVEAAAASGVGMTVARMTTLSPDLRPVLGLPPLPGAEIRLHRRSGMNRPAHVLADFLQRRLTA